MNNELLNCFVDFTGEETEKEFLEKCLKQYENVAELNATELQKFMIVSQIFNEIRHRIEELVN